MDSDIYKTIKSISEGIYKEKGSRFIAYAHPVTEVEDVKKIVEKIRKEHYEARHHCYAYMLSPEKNVWRVNDDGEPSGTAGRPILGQINSAGLTNILIVVTRYFGGTLLGVSGLLNAYRTAAANAISNAEIIEQIVQEYYRINFPYASMNDIMKILKEENLGQSQQMFDLECSMIVNFRLSSKEKVLNRLARVEGINCTYLETH